MDSEMDQGVWQPGSVAPLGVFNTLCLDGTMDEWLTDIDEVSVPHAWANDGWYGM